MASSINTLDQITANMVQQDVVVNANFAAASPAMGYGRQQSTTAALTWGYNEAVIDVSGLPTLIAEGTIALTASSTIYLYRTSAGAVVAPTSAPTGWRTTGGITSPAGAQHLYEIVTGADTVTSYEDLRTGGGGGGTGTPGTNWAVSVNAQTGTTYTLVTGDNGKVVTLSNASAITLTIPSGLGANFACELIQIGAGQVTVVGSGITLNSFGSLTVFAGQHAAARVVAYVANVFNLSGNLV